MKKYIGLIYKNVTKLKCKLQIILFKIIIRKIFFDEIWLFDFYQLCIFLLFFIFKAKINKISTYHYLGQNSQMKIRI